MAGESLQIVCVFWGESHRSLFEMYGLASIVAADNKEAIISDVGVRHRLVICTTEADLDWIERRPLFLQAKKFLEIDFVDIGDPDRFKNKYLAMSHGHALAAERAFQLNACAVFLTPDMVLGAGSLAALIRYRDQERALVLCAAVRFEQEGVELALAQYRTKNGELQISSRSLIDIALDNLHLEARKFVWDSPIFAKYPYNLIFRVNDGAILHSFSWAPLLVNYGRISQHDVSTLDDWTLDGDYVVRNFGWAIGTRDLVVVSDSDELAMISLTPSADISFIPEAAPETGSQLLRVPGLGNFLRRQRVYSVCHLGRMDDLKRSIAHVPIHLRGAARRFGQPDRKATLKEIERIMSFALKQQFLFSVIGGVSQNGIRSGLNYAVTSLIGLLPTGTRQKMRRLIGRQIRK